MIISTPADGITYHEDLAVGAEATRGAYDVTRDGIIAFATAYDPQPMHLDEAAAKASIVGGLCASGFHTCAIMMRLLYDNFIARSASLGSPGIDEVKWLKPVRPGDRLSVHMKVLDSRPLQSRPDVGVVKLLTTILDASGTPVLTCSLSQLNRRRHPGPAVPIRHPAAPKAATPTLWDEAATTTPPAAGNFFEDQLLGEVRDLGSHTFERDEIIGFARQFDPQPFHLNEDAGRRSLFGGLSASGWHTAAIYIRQMILTRQSQAAASPAIGQPDAAWGPSPGFRDLRWLKPVLVGDRIAFRIKSVEKRDLKSRPDRGLLIFDGEGRNQRGETVYRITSQVFVERRRTAINDPY